ncbi:MAG: hypothetical protein IJH13_00370 [Bacilli bacterium]|nr:hypothetical protein [Bacilli bacterium]
MEYIKAHKFMVVALIVLVLLLIMIVQLKNIFLPKQASGAAYGDRLAGIKKVKINNDLKDSIKSKLESDGMVKKAVVRTQGRILRVTVTVEDSVLANDAKSLADIVKNKISSKQNKYFDTEIIIKKDANDASFPIIGYKQHTKDNFSWTKDR